jgi:hypothetical protein
MLDTFRGFVDSLSYIIKICYLLSSKPRNVSSIEWQILVIYDQVDCHQNHEMCLA